MIFRAKINTVHDVINATIMSQIEQSSYSKVRALVDACFGLKHRLQLNLKAIMVFYYSKAVTFTYCCLKHIAVDRVSLL